jgi:hypothetical protein
MVEPILAEPTFWVKVDYGSKLIFGVFAIVFTFAGTVITILKYKSDSKAQRRRDWRETQEPIYITIRTAIYTATLNKALTDEQRMGFSEAFHKTKTAFPKDVKLHSYITDLYLKTLKVDTLNRRLDPSTTGDYPRSSEPQYSLELCQQRANISVELIQQVMHEEDMTAPTPYEAAFCKYYR